MSDQRNERIRERAHSIWEQEGRPDGRDHEHWRQAVAEIDDEDARAVEANEALNEKSTGKTGTGRRKRATPGDAESSVTQANEEAGSKVGGGRKASGGLAAGIAAVGEKIGSGRTAKRAASPKPEDEAVTGATRKRRSTKSE